jgi:hypothetical protein
MDPDAITTPHDCAFALAIPLERSVFLRDLEPGPREYARFYRTDNGGESIRPETLWDRYEQTEAGPIRAVVAEARSLGAEVVTDCTLAGLVGLLRRKRVVVVAAHWHDGRLRRADILDPAALCHRLVTDRDGVVAALRQRLSRDCVLELNKVGPSRPVSEDWLGEVLTQINAALAVGLLLPPSGPQAPSPPTYYVDRNRAALVDACPEAIADTVGLELSDATWSAAQVCEAIGHDLYGLLDLTVCHSVLLADEIKHANPNCTVIANREVTPPGVRLLIVREILRRLALAPGSYLRIALALRAALRGG